MPKAIQRLINLIFLAVNTLLTALFALTAAGVIDLRVQSQQTFAPWLEIVLLTMMFLVNVYFFLRVSMGGKVAIWTIAYLPIYLLTLTLPNIIRSTILPILYGAALNRWQKRVPDSQYWINAAAYTIFMFVAQSLMAVVKAHWWSTTVLVTNARTCFLYSIDLYTLMILYERMVRNDVWNRLARLYVHLPWRARIREDRKGCGEDCGASEVKSILDESASPIVARAIYHVIAVVYGLAQVASVLVVGGLDEKLLETLIILLVFWAGRPILGKSWHSSVWWICMAASIVTFHILARITLPLQTSMFNAVVAGGILAYIMSQAAHIEDWREFYERHNTFTLDTATADTMRERCRLCKLSAEDTDMAITLFVDKLSAKEAAARYSMDDGSVRNKKHRLKRRLMTF